MRYRRVRLGSHLRCNTSFSQKNPYLQFVAARAESPQQKSRLEEKKIELILTPPSAEISQNIQLSYYSQQDAELDFFLTKAAN